CPQTEPAASTVPPLFATKPSSLSSIETCCARNPAARGRCVLARRISASHGSTSKTAKHPGTLASERVGGMPSIDQNQGSGVLRQVISFWGSARGWLYFPDSATT